MMAHALRFRPFLRPRCPRPRGLILMPATPEQLLKRVARTQDRAAFEELFERFAPRVKAYLMRLGAPAQTADDLAQEAMLSLWRKAHLFDPARASVSTWIFTIARNLRIDALRRERNFHSDPMAALEIADPDANSFATLEAKDDGEVLRAALATLPDEQAQVVQLSFFSDKPHSQIAEDLRIPLGTVKSRLRLAMVRLRAALGEGS